MPGNQQVVRTDDPTGLGQRCVDVTRMFGCVTVEIDYIEPRDRTAWLRFSLKIVAMPWARSLCAFIP